MFIHLSGHLYMGLCGAVMLPPYHILFVALPVALLEAVFDLFLFTPASCIHFINKGGVIIFYCWIYYTLVYIILYIILYIMNM